MNAPLRNLALAMMAMVGLLLANLTYIQVVQADELRSDPRNVRQLIEQYSHERGQIIAGGLALASSTKTEGQLVYRRTYRNGPMYAPVTGFYSVRYGTGGMEAAMNEVLSGGDGQLFLGQVADLITGQEPGGGNVVLTIEPAVQRAAYLGLAERGYTGAVVALNPQTGAVLAMASTPSYDPNRLASHDPQVQERAWQAYTAERNGVPLRNRAVEAIYPPGSTFKLVTAAAALESGVATPRTRLTADPVITLRDTATQLENYAGIPCGSGPTASLAEALARSCNTAFAQLAAMVGEQALREQAQQFGVGTQDLRIPIRVTPSQLGEIVSVAALQQSGIGQRSVALTPLRNAVIAATIGNDGARMKPQMVRKVLAPDLTVVEEFEPEKVEQAISPKTAEQLTRMMIRAEQFAGGGTVAGAIVASKTGTAEHGPNPKQTPPHVWYVAFAPAQDPTVAVAVLVENGGNSGLDATGASVAAPIGREVIAAALAEQG